MQTPLQLPSSKANNEGEESNGKCEDYPSDIDAIAAG